ncbi:MAG: BTAD domain-containing putative transcriptional regulator [Acidimicrobiia bacterium]
MSASAVVRRDDLEHLLDAAVEGRLTTVVAGAGFGKTTLLSSWSATRSRAWHTVTPADRDLPVLATHLIGALRARVPRLEHPALPLAGFSGRAVDAEALASHISRTLAGAITRQVVLILDDLHELGDGGPAVALIDSLVRQAPPQLHFVVASREVVPIRTARLRTQHQHTEVGPDKLMFSLDEVHNVLETLVGGTSVAVAREIHRVTNGWPAAVALAAESVDQRDLKEWTSSRQGTQWSEAFEFLAEEVWAREDPDDRELLRIMAVLPTMSAGLAVHLGFDPAGATLRRVASRGLYLQDGAETGDHALSPVVRDFLLVRHPLEPQRRHSVLTRAADWYLTHANTAEALRLAVLADNTTLAARLLVEHGTRLVQDGDATLVLEAIDLLETPPPAIAKVEGAAAMATGDWDRAERVLMSVAGDEGSVPAGVAWRLGLIHHLRGDIDAADAAYGRGTVESSAEGAILAAWHAALLWLRGDVKRSRELADTALTLARAEADPRAMAVSHTVLAMVAALESDRSANEFHYVKALEWAERANDPFLIVRIRVNRGSHHMEEGDFREALDELDHALALADVAGLSTLRALALSNRGTVLYSMGRLEEALQNHEEARAMFDSSGSRLVSYALNGLAEVRRTRGERSAAEALYTEAIGKARAAGDQQGLVPALSGLSQLVCEHDPARAAELAADALEAGPVLGRVHALIASSRAAAALGQGQRAETYAREAVEVAGARRDRSGLAEALEQLATLSENPEEMLEEALALHRDLGNPIGAARLDLALAYSRRTGAAVIETKRENLIAYGARWDLEQAERHAVSVPGTRLVVETLGGLRVTRRDGTVVTSADWQSKKARDLFKILITRRGRPLPREQLIEMLWPGDGSDRVGNRLSAALTTVRRALEVGDDSDGDGVVTADRDVLAIDMDQITLDLDIFLRTTAAGIRALESGRRAIARRLLEDAMAVYAGDFLEEEIYAEWSVDLREEARQLFVRAARALADDAIESGDSEVAIRWLLLILEKDVYDERAHLALVRTLIATGAHGEARRLYRRYVDRMGELDIEPAPYPQD